MCLRKWNHTGTSLDTLMPEKLTLSIPALLLALLLSSCQTGPEARISQDPAKYSRLSSSDKELVSQGNIRKGMTRDAVYLAWGRPDIVREGSAGEAWAYVGSAGVPVRSLSYANIHRPYYSHFGVHPRYGYCSGSGWYLDSGIDFVPYVQKTVRFSGNRVTSWERTR